MKLHIKVNLKNNFFYNYNRKKGIQNEYKKKILSFYIAACEHCTIPSF